MTTPLFLHYSIRVQVILCWFPLQVCIKIVHELSVDLNEHGTYTLQLHVYIVACHLPRAPSYGGVRTWVEGSQMHGDRALARA